MRKSGCFARVKNFKFLIQNLKLTALYGIDILRQCEPQVANWVTFHILYPTAVKPRHREPKSALLSEDCTESMKQLTELKTKNYQRNDGIKELVITIKLLGTNLCYFFAKTKRVVQLQRLGN